MRPWLQLHLRSAILGGILLRTHFISIAPGNSNVGYYLCYFSLDLLMMLYSQLGYSFYWCTTRESHERITDYRNLLKQPPVAHLFVCTVMFFIFSECTGPLPNTMAGEHRLFKLAPVCRSLWLPFPIPSQSNARTTLLSLVMLNGSSFQ